MFVVVNRFVAPAGQAQAVVEGFRQAAPAMRQFAGFRGIEIWTADDDTVQVISRWDSREALDDYRQHDLFRQHHGRGPQPQRAASPQVSYYSGELLD